MLIPLRRCRHAHDPQARAISVSFEINSEFVEAWLEECEPEPFCHLTGIGAPAPVHFTRIRRGVLSGGFGIISLTRHGDEVNEQHGSADTTLVDIEQHMTGKWVEEQLGRLELLVREHGGDDEMLAVIEFLRDENDWWAVPQVEELDRSGRLIPLFDPSVRSKLLNLPLKVAHELRTVKAPTVRQAQRMQMAAALDTLLHVPMRIRNLSELDLSSTIIPPVAGSIGCWRISIPACEVKNQWAIDAQLGEEVGAILDRYVTVFRPVLMRGPTSALFVGQRGARKQPPNLSKQLAGFVRREIGVIIHAHLMRHPAAHLYLLANPGDYETVRRLLGHKKIETTTR